LTLHGSWLIIFLVLQLEFFISYIKGSDVGLKTSARGYLQVWQIAQS